MSYTPKNPPGSMDPTVTRWIFEEFQRIAAALDEPRLLHSQVFTKPVDKPRDGMIITVDGTDWDPGDGPGVYSYRSGAWQKL